MAEDEKKRRELAILRKAFPKKNYPTVESSEKPDFMLNNADGSKFGVEITEFYTTGSTARIKNIPNYLQELISDSKFRHKDDIKSLKVDTFKVYREGEQKNDVRGVFMESMSLQQRMEILVSMITEKNKKFSEYDKSLPYIELLIYDADNLFGVADKNLAAHTLMLYLKPVLVENTGFKDILLTYQDNDHEYLLSIVENVFMANVMSAVGFAQNCKSQIDAAIKDSDDVAGVDFIEAILRHNGFTITKLVYYQQNPQATKRKALLFRNSVVCADEEGFNIYDFGAEEPTGLVKRPNTLPHGLPVELVATYGEFIKQYMWAATIYRREQKLPPIKVKRAS